MQKSIFRTVAVSLLAGAAIFTPIASAYAQTEVFTVRRYSETGSFLAGLAALDSLRADRASDYFMRAAENDWDNPVFTSRAFLSYLLAGKISDAAAIAQHVLELDPQDELARLTLGTVALKQRRYASTDQTLARINEGSLIGITAGIMRAWAQVGSGNLGTAYATLDTVGEGGFAEFLTFHRALIADLGGDREQAVRLAREAYEVDPYVARIAEAYIRILGNAGQFEEAQAVLDDLADEGVDYPSLEALKAPISAGRRPGLFVADVQSGAAELYHGLGAALAMDGSSELGIVFLRLALYLEPGATSAAMTLGELLSDAGRYEDAARVYESVPRESPMRTSALIRLAENLDSQDRREEAISRLRNIINTEPGNIEALGVLGDILRYDEQWSEAASVYSQLIDTFEKDRPRDWRFYYVRGIAYERAGEWALAEPDFLKALELNPEHPHVLNYLGYSWVDQGMNLTEALEMIERAVEMAPRDGYIIDSLGWAFYKLGRIDEAIVELERAVQLLPDDPELNDHLGDVYWVAGRQREAMFQWRIAIDVDEAGNVTERARPKLINGLDPDAPIGD